MSATNRTDSLIEGSRFGAYLLGPCIGSGNMARVYRAESAELARPVALKVLCDHVAQDIKMRYRFLAEARAAASIKHPNVVEILDVGIQDGSPYLAMEFLEGQDLASLLHGQRALDESAFLQLLLPVAAGLAAGHEAGVVHGNLKPANIFLARNVHSELEPSGPGRRLEVEAKVLDFGISRELLGTPYYLSPEALQGADVTRLSDQYSLGVILYECATGVNPFQAQNFSDVFRLVTSGYCVPTIQRKPELSPRFAAIIKRAMSVDPEERFANIAELGRELLPLADRRTQRTWSLYFGAELSSLPPDVSVPLTSLAPTSLEAAPAHVPDAAAEPFVWTKRTTMLGVASMAALAVISTSLAFNAKPTISASSRSELLTNTPTEPMRSAAQVSSPKLEAPELRPAVVGAVKTVTTLESSDTSESDEDVVVHATPEVIELPRSRRPVSRPRVEIQARAPTPTAEAESRLTGANEAPILD